MDEKVEELIDPLGEKANSLAVSITEGKYEDFNKLYDIMYNKAKKYFLKRVPSEFIEDLITDTFIRAIEGLTQRKWQYQGKPFDAWFFCIAHNVYCEWVRKQRRLASELHDPNFKYEDVEDNELPILEQILRAEDAMALWSLAEALPDFQYRVLYERYKNNLCFGEIALALGKSEDNCRKAHERALKKLRDEIRKSNSFEDYIP